MKTARKIAIASSAAALCAAFGLPAGASAEYYVPPGNSAVNQYTESIPGAGGESGGKKKDVTPAEAIGAKNAKQLQQKGEAGEEAAEVAAETAPSAELYASDSGEGGAGAGAGGPTGSGGADDASGSAGSGVSAAGGGNGDAVPTGSVQVSQPKGSSAISSILGEATGAGDGGNVGLWLPLAIVAILAGAVVYRLRQPGPTG